MALAWPRSGRTRITFVVVVIALATAVLLAGWWYAGWKIGPAHAPAADVAHQPREAAVEGAEETPETPGLIEFPRESWQAAKIALQPVAAAPLTQTIELTGKVTLNEDRVAHIYPLVEGRVERVNVRLGQEVKQGELLAVVQSKEVGQAMLKLYEDRLLLEYAKVKDRWTQSVKENTHALIDMIRDGAPLDAIEDAFRQRTLGSHRDTLLSAYISLHAAKAELDRLKPLASGGAVAARRLVETEAQLNAARATLQSLVEQIRQDTVQESLESAQRVKEFQTRVSVGEANLKIIGYSDEDLAAADPLQRGEAISHYPVVAPFDGTIISKDVVLLERVGPENQILSIADLSTVWVSADIYQEHLHLTQMLDGATVVIKSDAWPGQSFEAQVFYTGDVVDEASRTISLRAVADNAHGQLKPGMFVSVEVSGGSAGNVVQVPLHAVYSHGPSQFVFVHLEGDQFARRDVILGGRNQEVVEIATGLEPGEMVVVEGGFALKSQMLADLLEED